MTQMTNFNKRGPLLSAMAFGMVMTTALAPVSFAQRARTIRLDAGTVIPVRLERELSSRENRSGDRFTATVREDSQGYTILPEGTTLEGTIRTARPKRGNDAGVLDLDFQRAVLPNGRSYSIDASLIGLDNKSVTRGRDGRLIAKRGADNNRLVYAGYGAGAGLLVGMLSGGKLRLENGLLGAGLGYLLGSLQKGDTRANDVTLKEGTEMGVKLKSGLSFTGYATYRDEDRDRMRYREDTTNWPDRNRDYQERDRDYRDSDRLDRRRDSVHPIGMNGYQNPVVVRVDGNEVIFPENLMPYRINGTIMVPVRPVAEAAGLVVSFNNVTQKVQVEGINRGASITVGSRIAVINGHNGMTLPATCRFMNGSIYVPKEFFQAVTSKRVHWDSASQTMSVVTY